MKVNLLIKQVALMRGRDQSLKFVPADKVKECSSKINKMLKKEFDASRDECIRTLDIAKIKFHEVSKETQVLDSRKREDLNRERNKYKNRLDKELGELRKNCDDKVKL
jgi:hypothetical protein